MAIHGRGINPNIATILTEVAGLDGDAMRGTDDAALASVMDSYINHQKLFTGLVYYVDAAAADNTGSGLSPETAKQSPNAMIAAAAAGDAINIKAGVYAENIVLNKNSVELWCEIGAIFAGDAGIPLTISGSYCKVEGRLTVMPTAQIGVLISGIQNVVIDTKVRLGTVGYHVTGAGNLLSKCAAGLQTTCGYDLDGDQTRLYDCNTVGNDTTIGYNISDGADIGVLYNCTSVGHETAGYNVDTGCNYWTIKDCSSGGGDGARIDAGAHNMWSNFSDTLRRDNHVHIYPFPDGEGTAGSPISITTDAADETNAIASTADYFGEPFVLVAPEVYAARWDYIGNNIYATTKDKAFRGSVYRVVNAIRAVRDAGNAWDEGATVLTFDDATDFVAGDLIWIQSSAYKSEIVRITDVTGAVVTIEREASQFGAPNTGLRWDHTTNIGAGTLYAYLCWRDEPQYHSSDFDYSAGTAKDFSTFNFPKPRGMNANDGLVVRLQNSTDGTNAAGLDMTICLKD